MLSLALLLTACTPDPKPADESLDALCLRVLREFDDADLDSIGETMASTIEASVLPAEGGVRLGSITDADVRGLAYDPGVDWGQVYGAAVARTLEGTIDDYASLMPLSDQGYLDGYESWDRSIVAGTAEGYLDGRDLAVEDSIVKQAPFGILLPYPSRRDLHWVDLPRGRGQVQRGVIYEAGFSDDGKSGVIVGFTVEMWFPASPSTLTWMNATWTQVVTPLGDLATEEFLAGEIVDGGIEVMESTEAHLAE
jgi:hypothetical protein